MKALIVAGGSGSRLWPVSRASCPKQVQPFIDKETLLQKTYNRVLQGFSPEDIFISTGQSLVSAIKAQLPNIDPRNLIVEPVRRDKAPAIGLAATILQHRYPDSYIITVWSDHYIKDVPEYVRILKLVKKVLKANPRQTVMVGINPDYPEIGYGYIQTSKKVFNVGNDEILELQQFVEKPDLATAQQYIDSGNYLWNPGMFGVIRNLTGATK